MEIVQLLLGGKDFRHAESMRERTIAMSQRDIIRFLDVGAEELLTRYPLLERPRAHDRCVDEALQLHFSEMSTKTPLVIWREFFRQETHLDPRTRRDICCRFAAQSEQWEAEVQRSSSCYSQDVDADRHGFWRLTSFLSFCLLPSLVVASTWGHGTDLTRLWLSALGRRPEMFREGGSGHLLMPLLFASVGWATCLNVIGQPDIIFKDIGDLKQ